MQTSSARPPVAETDSVPLQINLLALNLALELARLMGSARSAGLPRLSRCDLSDLLEDDLQMGAGEGLRRAVEELQRALHQTGELALRSPASESSALADEPECAEASGR